MPLHNRGENVLNVGDPQVERAGSENQLRRNSVRKGNDSGIAVHCRKTAAADSVEADSLGTRLAGQSDQVVPLSRLNDPADQKGKVTVNGDINISLFERADIDL